MRSEIYSAEHQKLRKILKRERLQAGLRQSDLAEKTNRSQAYISKFEKGDLRLDVIDFMRICDAIGCDYKNVLEEIVNFRGNIAQLETSEIQYSEPVLPRRKRAPKSPGERWGEWMEGAGEKRAADASPLPQKAKGDHSKS